MERIYHADYADGLKCISDQLDGEPLQRNVIDSYMAYYTRDSSASKWCQALIHFIPYLFYFVGRAYDYYLDGEFGAQFWRGIFDSKKSESATELPDGIEILRGAPVKCRTLKHSSTDNIIAFLLSAFSFTLPLMFLLLIVRMISLKGRKEPLPKTMSTIGEPIPINAELKCLCWCPFVVPAACNTLISKCKHEVTDRKDRYTSKVRWHEYLWAAYGMIETCFEACFQLMLQSWLLSAHMPALKDLGLFGSFKRALEGALSFVCDFGICDIDVGDDMVAKSLGKAFVSSFFVALSYGSCTKMMKKGSMKTFDHIFLMLSVFCQIVANLIPLLVIQYAFWCSIYPLLVHLLIRFIVIFFLKRKFERTSQDRGFFGAIIRMFNTLSSSFVYLKLASYFFLKDVSPRPSRWERSTFLEQTLYTAIVLPINLLMIVISIVFHLGPESCLTLGDFIWCAFHVLWLTLFAIIFRVIYYSFYGHPWKELNGPQRKRRGKYLGYYFTCRKYGISYTRKLPMSGYICKIINKVTKKESSK